MKKILALILAMMLVLTMGVAFATEADATTGSITVKNATKGYAYKAYKILDATYSTSGETTNVSYTTKTPDLFGGDTSPWTVGTIADSKGNYSVQLKDGKTADDINTWIKNNLSSFTAINPTEGTDSAGLASAAAVKWTGLDFGYYYITSGLGANVTVDSTTPDAEVYDKNETTPVDPVKTIIAVDGVEQNKVTSANAHVGSVVKFQVDARTNNWIDQDTLRTEWTFTDKPTNMSIDPETIVVKVNGTEITKFTAAGTSDGGFNLTIPLAEDGASIYPANTLDEDNTILGLIPIEITYEATILATAGSAPAKNEIPGDNPPPPVVVYTYAIMIEKVDETGEPLPGAQFELWSTMGGSTDTKLTFIDNKDGTYTYSPDGTVTTLNMVENTTIVVKGLDTAWTYTLKEITVPAGYNQAPDKTIQGSELTKVEEITSGEGETTTTTLVDTTVESEDLNKVTVENKAGQELPETGGIGTTILYVVGSILVLAAVILLVTKRRMSAND